MYLAGSDLFNALCREQVKTYRARLVCGEEVVESFQSINLTGASTSTNTYQLGSCVSSQIDVITKDLATVFTDKWWRLEVGIKVSSGLGYDDVNAYEFIPMGVFKVKTQQKTNTQRTFSAFDKISVTDVPCKPSGVTTTHGVLDYIATTCGVTINNTNIRNDAIDVGEDYLCRDVLGAIAQLNGCSVYADRVGTIVFKKYEVQNTLYTASDTRGFSVNENEFSFTNVIAVTGGFIASESGEQEVRLHPTNEDTSGNTILIANPYITQAILDRLYENDIVLWQYNVANVPLALGDPRLDPWDVVTVSDNNGVVYTIPCMNLMQNYSGGFTTNITSYGEDETQTEAGYISPYKRFQNAITTALLTVEKLIANIAEIGGFKIDGNGLSCEFPATGESFRINSYGQDANVPNPHLLYGNSEGGVANYPSYFTVNANRYATWTDFGNKKTCIVLDSSRNSVYVYNSNSTPDSGISPLIDSDGRMQVSMITPTDIYEHDEKLEDKYSRRYRIGETHTINNIYVCGTITAGKGEVIINYVIPNGLSKDISGLSSISIKGRIRHNNAYVFGSGTSGGDVSLPIKNFSIRDRYNILITIDTSSVSSSITTNNDICSVQLVSGSLKFS